MPAQQRIEETVERVHQVGLAGIIAPGDDCEFAEFQLGILHGTNILESKRHRFGLLVVHSISLHLFARLGFRLNGAITTVSIVQ